ncbi:lycopene cyclase domain-containing protein [Sediminicola luteus]|uniref:Lycopene cyclase domain-containing protein n=1 Tax=Sediminicola luteus TaxID=319238 RepID=A0A2A4G4Y3_9FLAO|nr:lycopene cyclase domain-containing protein [Sediminicola luteus]PCE63046.1 hypothetical protein B7P33_17385 [Sediminicola luteus]
MNWLYLALNLGSLSIPLWYSFNPKMRFIKHWKVILVATALVALLFLVWDGLFTAHGIWGFNPAYFLGPKIWGMPIEEWLFFFCIPYASLFIHYSLEYFRPQWLLSLAVVRGILIAMILLSAVLLLFFYDRWYTLVDFLFLAVAAVLGLLYGQSVLRRFFIAFPIILIPFFLVNGVLTGTGLPEPVVWYNDSENMGIRLGTIPVEDMAYAFSMLFFNLLLIERWKKE